MTDHRARYPHLHAPQRWEWGGFSAQFSTEPPPQDLVTNVHGVCFVGQDVVVCRDSRGAWFLPGGTREAGESIEACLARELREEAGATLVGLARWIGAHYCVSDHAEPYRAWQPHPRKAWLWCHADVTVDGAPTNPADGEQVVEVRVVSPAEAGRLLPVGGAHLGDLVALAVELRALPESADD